MFVIKEMNLPINVIFDAIVLSFRQDYYASTQEDIEEEAIKPGVTYIKYFGHNNKNSIRLRVKEFSRPELYQIVYSSNQGKQIITYHLKELEPDLTEVTYEQESEGEGFFQKANTWLMDKVFSGGVKKKVEAQLTALEAFAHTSSQQLTKRK